MITYFGHFTRYIPANEPRNIFFYRNEDGLDFYDLRKVLSPWVPETGAMESSVYEVYADCHPETGVIEHVGPDAAQFVPIDKLFIGWDGDASEIQVGMIYDLATNTLLPAPPYVAPVPAQITMRQAKLCLHRAGLLTMADTSIASMEGDAGIEARIEWTSGTNLERNSATVARVAEQLELPAEQVDALFIWAASL